MRYDVISPCCSLACLTVSPLQSVTLEPGHATYEQLKDPSLPLWQDFYFFNLTNPELFATFGEKPNLTEVGPYSYRSVSYTALSLSSTYSPPHTGNRGRKISTTFPLIVPCSPTIRPNSSSGTTAHLVKVWRRQILSVPSTYLYL